LKPSHGKAVKLIHMAGFYNRCGYIVPAAGCTYTKLYCSGIKEFRKYSKKKYLEKKNFTAQPGFEPSAHGLIVDSYTTSATPAASHQILGGITY